MGALYYRGFHFFHFFQHRYHHHSRVFFNNEFFHDGNSQKNMITNLFTKYSAVQFAGCMRDRERGGGWL